MVEEVACALLDATRRMSISGGRVPASPGRGRFDSSEGESSSVLSSSVGSANGFGGWLGSWSSSVTELEDKTGSLPKSESGSFFGAIKRNRAMSESDGSSRVKIGVIGWLAGQNNGVNGQAMRKVSEPEQGFNGYTHRRIRRSSSKDVEEAMAGGLNKADIYMPPF